VDKEAIVELVSTFESFRKNSDEGIEFWLARDLQKLLGYLRWENFQKVLEKARVSCITSGNYIPDHFRDVTKMVLIGSGAETEVSDIILTRYACYLIAQNGDPRKEQIAFAQAYFASQTRKMEIIEQRLYEVERVTARKKLAETEKKLSGIIFEFTGSDKNFGIIRSKGDKALFNYTTEEMKIKWNIPKGKPLADFAPTIILKAKDLASEMTIFNTKSKKLHSEQDISKEHITNNQSIRNTLIDRGIVPESLSPEEDVKKVERKLISSSTKKLKSKKKSKE